MKKSIVGLSRESLLKEPILIGQKPFRIKQIWKWLYFRGKINFSEMTDISLDFRDILENNFYIYRPNIIKQKKSIDGTIKWLLGLNDSNEIEMVYIPEENRGTLCVSSQVGCTLSCSFCHTGTMKLKRNLTSEEIIGQLLIAKDVLNDWDTKTQNRIITNIVFMGMGEPLYNYDNVLNSLKIMVDGEGLSISKRKITISTSGVVSSLEKLKNDLDVNLAVSLHAVENEVRDKLVPINRKWPIEKLIECLSDYSKITNSRRITFEYIMLKNINDSEEDAKKLAKILVNINSKINLIPFNNWPGSKHTSSDLLVIERFKDIIYKESSITVTIRGPRGSDIGAACGQLKSEVLQKRI